MWVIWSRGEGYNPDVNQGRHHSKSPRMSWKRTLVNVVQGVFHGIVSRLWNTMCSFAQTVMVELGKYYIDGLFLAVVCPASTNLKLRRPGAFLVPDMSLELPDAR